MTDWHWDPEEWAEMEADGDPWRETTPFPEALTQAFESIVQAFAHDGRNRDPSVLNLRYREYLATPHWQTLRNRMIAKAGYQCQHCGEGDGPIDVHHLTYDRLGREPDDDLVVLCRQCHAAEHGK